MRHRGRGGGGGDGATHTTQVRKRSNARLSAQTQDDPAAPPVSRAGTKGRSAGGEEASSEPQAHATKGLLCINFKQKRNDRFFLSLCFHTSDLLLRDGMLAKALSLSLSLNFFFASFLNAPLR